MVTHPADMTAWPAIACERGCSAHAIRNITVDLARPHAYADLTPVPARLAALWPMVVWDTSIHPVDGGPYCPAHDAVSETILTTGVWEPRETVLALDVLHPGDTFLDLGCQIGWFSMAAMSRGARVIAVDADPDNLAMANMSAQQLLSGRFTARLERIGPGMDPFTIQPYRLVKIDLEGAEADAIDLLWDAILDDQVDHVLMEVSPIFKPGNHYPDLLSRLVRYCGYEAYFLPPKSSPPTVYVDAESFLAPYRIDDRADMRQLVADCGQEDVWLRRKGAAW